MPCTPSGSQILPGYRLPLRAAGAGDRRDPIIQQCRVSCFTANRSISTAAPVSRCEAQERVRIAALRASPATREHPIAMQAQARRSPCLDPEALAALLDGTLSNSQQARLFAHLVLCDSCYQRAIAQLGPSPDPIRDVH
jgi:hypothetical protein